MLDEMELEILFRALRAAAKAGFVREIIHPATSLSEGRSRESGRTSKTKEKLNYD